MAPAAARAFVRGAAAYGPRHPSGGGMLAAQLTSLLRREAVQVCMCAHLFAGKASVPPNPGVRIRGTLLFAHKHVHQHTTASSHNTQHPCDLWPASPDVFMCAGAPAISHGILACGGSAFGVHLWPSHPKSAGALGSVGGWGLGYICHIIDRRWPQLRRMWGRWVAAPAAAWAQRIFGQMSAAVRPLGHEAQQ